jgi:flagellar biosynthetic protein FliO
MNYPPEMTTTAIKMVLSLLVVLAMLWGLYRFTRRNLVSGPIGANGRLIKVLANQYLGVKKSITLVQVPGAILVLGVSADRVNLLSRIKDPDIVSRFEKQEQPGTKTGFRDQLQRFLHPMNAGWKPAGRDE